MSKAGERVATAATVPPNPITPPSHSLYFKLWQSESTNPSLGVKVRVLRSVSSNVGGFKHGLHFLSSYRVFTLLMALCI